MRQLRRQFVHPQANRVLALVVAASVAVAGAVLLITPTMRLVEHNDSPPLSERHEHSSPGVRLYFPKRLVSDLYHSKFSVVLTSNVRLAGSQRPDLHAPPGHRLSSDLLAPMTC